MNAPTRIARSQDRIIRMAEVSHRTGLHRATIYRKIAEGEFPHGIPLGRNSSGWYESEVGEWIANPLGWKESAAA